MYIYICFDTVKFVCKRTLRKWFVTFLCYQSMLCIGLWKNVYSANWTESYPYHFEREMQVLVADRVWESHMDRVLGHMVLNGSIRVSTTSLPPEGWQHLTYQKERGTTNWIMQQLEQLCEEVMSSSSAHLPELPGTCPWYLWMKQFKGKLDRQLWPHQTK